MFQQSTDKSQPEVAASPAQTDQLDRLADQLGIKRSDHWSENAHQVADNARRAMTSDPLGFVRAYRNRFGNLFGADDAAELFPEYSASAESRAKFHSAVHGAARWVRDAAFSEALASPNGPRRVIFTSGGSAAGKTTLAPALLSGGDAVVYDSTLSVLPGAQVVIEAALAAGKAVTVVHIRRLLDDAFKANLSRATQATGNGRTTTITSMVRTHRGADEVFVALADRYRTAGQIDFVGFENPGGHWSRCPSTA